MGRVFDYELLKYFKGIYVFISKMAIRFINILKELILETSRFEFIYNKYTKNKEGNSDEISINHL